MSRVAVIGAGYVGLTTACCFAHLEHHVICADIDRHRVEMLARGEVPILEDRLEALLQTGLKDGRLEFVVGAANAVADAEFVYLCVPTPQSENGAADLSYIRAAVSEIRELIPANSIVVTKSTVPIGSASVVEEVLQRPDVSVVSNPEFLREGTAVHDFLHPDRVVVGARSREAAARVASLYLGLAAPTIVTDPPSAETIKYASNSFLAMKVSFANAIAAVCEAVGADVHDVLLGMGYDARIGQQFLRPGPGWGGSCFPKDVAALMYIAEEAGYDFHLLEGVARVNEEQFERMVAKVVSAVGGPLAGRRVAVWGLTFKANTDDLRDSPAIAVVERLLAAGAEVVAYDPAVPPDRSGHPSLTGVTVAVDPYEAVTGAEALVVLTEWDAFRWFDFAKVAELMVSRHVVDTRNLLEPAELKRHGFTYRGVGRS